MRLCAFLILILSPQLCWAQAAVCVRGATATLRSEPRANAPITWVTGRYTPFIRLDRKGNWLKIQDMDGEIHWAFHSQMTSEIRCLSVRVGVTNLRQGPGKQFPLVDRPVADRYTPFKRLETAEDWYQVEDASGLRGWLHESSIWRPTVTQSINF